MDKLTPREMAKNGMPLSPTELILLENALTIAEQRIKELEAAQQWHPASEPPEADGDEYEAIRICNGKMYRRYSTFRDGKWNFVHRTISPVIFWRELPPMPGKESR